MIDPRTIEGAERIAHASSERVGGFGPRRDRWTEIGIWFDHSGGRKPWLVEIAGMTRVEGETNRHTRFAAGTLERAIKFIDTDGSLGTLVAIDAHEWADAHRATIQNARGKAVSFADDAAALAWLYGQPDDGHTGYAKMLAQDTGAGESTVRMALAAGRDVKIPLRALLPFLDRDAFRRAREARRG